MADLKQLPAELNIRIFQGDELPPIEMEFDIPITGYTFDGAIYIPATKQSVPLVLDVTHLAERKIFFSCEASASIPRGKQRWSLRWHTPEGFTRSFAAGEFEVV